MIKAIPFVFLLFLTVDVYAEPNQAIQFLSKEPVSMLDWGLYQLENSMQKARFGINPVKDTQVHVIYDQESNRINLEVKVFPNASTYNPVTGQEKNICRKVLGSIKTKFGYGASGSDREMRSIANTFKHRSGGFTSEGVPDNFNSEIEDITHVLVRVFTNRKNETPFTNRISCTDGLYDDNIRFLN